MFLVQSYKMKFEHSQNSADAIANDSAINKFFFMENKKAKQTWHLSPMIKDSKPILIGFNNLDWDL